MAELAFSVTLKDCDVQFFRAGGPGGQHQNKTSSACRIVHPPSGAKGESREHRSQLQNKRTAFRRMVDTVQFQLWIKKMLYGYDKAEKDVEAMMAREQDFKCEIKQNGKWVEVENVEA